MLLVLCLMIFRHHGRAVVFEDVEYTVKVQLAEMDVGEDDARISKLFKDRMHALSFRLCGEVR